MTEHYDLTLLRHGRSRADDEQVHEGRYDSPLTKVGRAQALARAQAWLAEDYRPNTIVASTLTRALEVGRIIGDVLQVPVTPDPDWMEIDNGPLAGLPFAEAATRYPIPSSSHPFAVWHGSGESQADVHARMSRALQRIFHQPAGRYLVVSHGGALNAALRVLLGISVPAHPAGVYFAFGDLGYARIRFNAHANRCVLQELVSGMTD